MEFNVGRVSSVIAESRVLRANLRIPEPIPFICAGVKIPSANQFVRMIGKPHMICVQCANHFAVIAEKIARLNLRRVSHAFGRRANRNAIAENGIATPASTPATAVE